jgi:hypothetical protein
MFTDTMPNSEDFDLSFKVFHELMAKKVTDILLISSPFKKFPAIFLCAADEGFSEKLRSR